MTVFYPGGGSTVDNLGMSIVGVGATTRTDVQNIKSGDSDLKVDGNNATVSSNQTTIRQSSTSAVLNMTNVSGYLAIQLGGTPVVGSTVTVSQASYPFNNVYKVISSSGSNYAITDAPYVSCTGIGNSGVYSVNTGSFDSPTQGDFVIMGNTTELAGVDNNALQRHAGGLGGSLHKFGDYRSRVYTDYWQSFYASGQISPCNVDTTVVTLAADEAAEGVPTVTMSIGLKVQAADLENPDTTGLRDPA